MFRSRQLRAERFKLLARHKKRRLKEQREIASLHRKIRRADASDLSRLKTLDSLLDRPEPDLRHVMEHILTDRCYAGSPYLLMHCLRAIQRTPDPPPQAIPKPDPCGSNSDEPRAKTESVDDVKAIQEAMSKVPEDYLRALIKLFAMSNDDFMHNVWDILEKRYKQLGERFTIKSIDPRPKRAAIVEDASVCDKCHNTFLQSENGAESCLYHFRDFEFYLDSGEWDGCDDLRDKEERAFHLKDRIFWYPCCGTMLDQETLHKKRWGCRTGRHWPRDHGRGAHYWQDTEPGGRPETSESGPAALK